MLVMHTTPTKQSYPSTEPNSLLKVAIEQRLGQTDLKDHQMAKHTRLSLDEQKDELKLLETIEMHESEVEPGYFNYENWLTFNAEYFQKVNQETVCSLWKIFRIINHGEVAIPTGLIYEVASYFLAKKNPSFISKGTLREVLNQFLRMNKTNEFLNNFRELANYPSLQEIQKEYCPNQLPKDKRSSSKATKQAHGGKELFNRLHTQGRKRQKSMRELKYASMVKQLSECKFTPNINRYDSKPSLKKCQRVCNHHPSDYSQAKEPQHKFIALEIDKKIYNGKLKEVPGVLEHIKRAECSQAQRQRIKRITSRSWLMIR